jgi:hypothetical protein
VQYGVSRQKFERATDAPAKRGGLLSRLRRTLTSAF